MDDIEDLVYQALVSLDYPVRYGWYDEEIEKTHVTYFCVLEAPEDHSDDEVDSLSCTIQVDIWSMTDEDKKLKKEIKKLMNRHGFKFSDSADLFETDTKIYHKAMRFNYYMEVEDE